MPRKEAIDRAFVRHRVSRLLGRAILRFLAKRSFPSRIEMFHEAFESRASLSRKYRGNCWLRHVQWRLMTIFTKRFARRKKNWSVMEGRGGRVNHGLTGIIFVSCRGREWNTSMARNNRSIKRTRFDSWIVPLAETHCRSAPPLLHSCLLIDDFSLTMTASRQLLERHALLRIQLTVLPFSLPPPPEKLVNEKRHRARFPRLLNPIEKFFFTPLASSWLYLSSSIANCWRGLDST